MTINLTEVMALARAELVRTGSLIPRVHVEMEDGEQLVAFFEGLPETASAREALLFLAGFEIAGGGPERAGQIIRPRQPREAAFAAEAWTVSARPGQSLDETPPSQHPDRVEAIVVAAVAVEPDFEVRVEVLPFDRAPRGGRIRFRARFSWPQGAEAQVPMMMSFWLGVAVAAHPDLDSARDAVAAARLLAGDVRIVSLEDLG